MKGTVATGLVAMVLAGCNGMGDQPSVRPYEPPAGRPALGAVAVGQVPGPEDLPDPESAAGVTNPEAGLGGVVASGQVAYRRYCRACHGPALDGLSTVGPSLSRGRLDLASPEVAGQPDGVLFWKTLRGSGRMPPLGATLTPREAWQVIAYLRESLPHSGGSAR